MCVSQLERFADKPKCTCKTEYTAVREKFDLLTCSSAYEVYTGGKVNTDVAHSGHSGKFLLSRNR
jgi:hypothetical protein